MSHNALIDKILHSIGYFWKREQKENEIRIIGTPYFCQGSAFEEPQAMNDRCPLNVLTINSPSWNGNTMIGRYIWITYLKSDIISIRCLIMHDYKWYIIRTIIGQIERIRHILDVTNNAQSSTVIQAVVRGDAAQRGKWVIFVVSSLIIWVLTKIVRIVDSSPY
jgi:hypothetical protein